MLHSLYPFLGLDSLESPYREKNQNTFALTFPQNVPSQKLKPKYILASIYYRSLKGQNS